MFIDDLVGKNVVRKKGVEIKGRKDESYTKDPIFVIEKGKYCFTEALKHKVTAKNYQVEVFNFNNESIFLDDMWYPCDDGGKIL